MPTRHLHPPKLALAPCTFLSTHPSSLVATPVISHNWQSLAMTSLVPWTGGQASLQWPPQGGPGLFQPFVMATQRGRAIRSFSLYTFLMAHPQGGSGTLSAFLDHPRGGQTHGRGQCRCTRTGVHAPMPILALSPAPSRTFLVSNVPGLGGGNARPSTRLFFPM